MNGIPAKQMLDDAPTVKVIIGIENEKLKKCVLCEELKPYNLFNKLKCSNDGHNYYCRDCSRIKLKEYYVNNPETAAKRASDWKRNNRDKENEYKRCYYSKYPEIVKAQNQKHTNKHLDKIKIRQKNYRANHIDEAKAYLAKWYIDHSDEVKKKTKQWARDNPDKVRISNRKKNQKKTSNPMGKLNRNMSFRIWTCLKKFKASKSWKSIVDFTVWELMDHLEHQFDTGMNWDNYGTWHVDHKIPLAAFRFKLPTDDEFQKAWALENLQPMWGIENIKKGKKILHPELYKQLTGRDAPL
ncbi:MAG TPA: hypothetical protein ACFYEK_18165 [Candidatus Wunengus sp. YC60]|uniref:hypothetical protein n=1 Tax=Candidatus Wunengus sp. YC60 TaxID=3367697 RepID=UPI004028796F